MPATSKRSAPSSPPTPTTPRAASISRVALNAKGDRKGALDELLTIIRKDRTFNDDAARKLLLQLFDAWGASDPVTIEGRQKLSSLLFA